MFKNNFETELRFLTTVQKGDKNKSVRRVQEWLCLNAMRFPAAAIHTAVDDDFGAATERAVRNFEEAIGVPKTGIVTPTLFAELAASMNMAFTTQPTESDIRKAVVQTAKLHLKQRAAELQDERGTNLGPWVRAYCDGNDGSAFLWCAGFAQSILDQAASAQERKFTAIMPRTLSCDELARAGATNGRLTRSAQLRNDPSRIKPGDLFLLRKKNVEDWFHVGIITSRSGDIIETIEGNTDSDGGSNGTGVFARVRNFRKSIIDHYSTEGL